MKDASGVNEKTLFISTSKSLFKEEKDKSNDIPINANMSILEKYSDSLSKVFIFPKFKRIILSILIDSISTPFLDPVKSIAGKISIYSIIFRTIGIL